METYGVFYVSIIANEKGWPHNLRTPSREGSSNDCSTLAICTFVNLIGSIHQPMRHDIHMQFPRLGRFTNSFNFQRTLTHPRGASFLGLAC